jgi:hypothetical protein
MVHGRRGDVGGLAISLFGANFTCCTSTKVKILTREEQDPLRNRTYRDDWEHYMQLIEEGVLPAESDNLGLLDYYEYLQVLSYNMINVM